MLFYIYMLGRVKKVEVLLFAVGSVLFAGSLDPRSVSVLFFLGLLDAVTESYSENVRKRTYDESGDGRQKINEILINNGI